ncbi:3271_t:CDS:10, partial [Gigaspora margarita]
ISLISEVFSLIGLGMGARVLAGKGYIVIDHPSKVYRIPDTHECIDRNQLLCLIINIDARQKPDPTNPKFVLASSSNAKKCSWYIIYPQTRFIDYRNLKDFVKKVIELVGKLYFKFIDIGLYKSYFNLQLLELAKEGCIKQPAISSEPIKEEFQPIDNENALTKSANLVIENIDSSKLEESRKDLSTFKHNPYYIDPKTKAILNPRLLPELSEKVINVKEIENFLEAYPNFLSKEPCTTLICSLIITGKTKGLRQYLNYLAKNKANISCIIWISYQKTLSNESMGKINDLKLSELRICNYQNEQNKTVEYLYDPNSRAKAMQIGFEFLRKGKCMIFVVISSNMAQALVKEASKLSFKAHAYYRNMNRKQQKKNFLDINTTWGELDCVAYTNTVEVGHENICAELVVARPNDLPIAINGHYESREVIGIRKTVRNKIRAEVLVIKHTNFETIATSRNLIFEEAESLKLNSECLVANTMSLKHFYIWNLYSRNSMSIKDWNKLCNKNFVKHFSPPEPKKHFLRLSHFYKQGYDEKKFSSKRLMQNIFSELLGSCTRPFTVAWFISINDKHILSNDKVKVVFEASHIKLAIKAINAIVSNWCGYTIKSEQKLLYNSCGFDNQEEVMARKLGKSEYCSIVPVLLSYKPKVSDKIQNLFDFISIINNITSEHVEHKISVSSSNTIGKKALFLEIPIQNQ